MLNDWLQRGLECHRAGRLDAARDIYNQVLSVDPRHPDALHLLGLVALQSGDAGLAADLIRKATARQPRNWAYWANLGRALMEAGRLDDALPALLKAGKLNSDEPQIAMSVANCLALQGRLPEAEARLRNLTRRHPDFVLGWLNLGHAARDQGRADDAARHYRRAIAIDPALTDAHNELGRLLHQQRAFEEAEQAFRSAVTLRADVALYHLNLASLLIDRGKFAEAEASARRAIALEPGSAIGHALVAGAISHQGRLLDALDSHRQAAELEPGNARSLTAYGAALIEVGRDEEGMAMLERALALAPDVPELHAQAAAAKLACGDFESGWREYLHRGPRARFVQQHPHVPLTSELAPGALADKHVCVLREQGLGDQIFFLRFAEELIARGARLTYRSAPKVAGILRRVAAIDRLILENDPMPAADYTILAGDLPLVAASAHARETGGSLRAQCPPPLALAPLPAALAAAGERLSRLGPPPYVGITWRAGVAAEEQTLHWQLIKQIGLQPIAGALRGVSATLLALQRNPGPGEIDQLAAAVGTPVHDLTDLNEDLETMLALLARIDEYVGVSNTNMHLRAGAGRRARVLVPCPAEWRWMTTGDASPWFPGFCIYRQSPDGTWRTALERLRHDLLAACGARNI